MHSQRLVFFMVALSIFGANFSPGAATLAAAATSAGQITLSAATYSVAQNAGAVTITVVRTGGSAGAAAVSYTTTNSTATAGTNFTTEQGQLTWATGDASPKTVRIPISNAKPFAGTKALGFYIAHPQGALLGASPRSATITINGSAGGQQTHGIAERESQFRPERRRLDAHLVFDQRDRLHRIRLLVGLHGHPWDRVHGHHYIKQDLHAELHRHGRQRQPIGDGDRGGEHPAALRRRRVCRAPERAVRSP